MLGLSDLGISFSLESFSGQYPSRLQMARAEVVSYIQKGSMNCQERGLSEALRHKPLHVVFGRLRCCGRSAHFCPEWWKNGAPDRMKLGAPMLLFLL
jgi:hypothetical protein